MIRKSKASDSHLAFVADKTHFRTVGGALTTTKGAQVVGWAMRPPTLA
jgi:hypothetical protein